MEPSFITSPSYDSIHHSVVQMVSEIAMRCVVDVVVSPIRGGLLAGVIASHQLNVPLIPVQYSSGVGKGGKLTANSPLPDNLPGKVMLLIDDIWDSGSTVTEIKQHYQQRGYTVYTAVIHFKDSGGDLKPDVYYWKISPSSPFITYPYEQ